MQLPLEGLHGYPGSVLSVLQEASRTKIEVDQEKLQPTLISPWDYFESASVVEFAWDLQLVTVTKVLEPA
jgi:hypothetical protein